MTVDSPLTVRNVLTDESEKKTEVSEKKTKTNQTCLYAPPTGMVTTVIPCLLSERKACSRVRASVTAVTVDGNSVQSDGQLLAKVQCFTLATFLLA